MTAEIRRLQGAWNIVTLEVEGQPMAKSMLSGAKIVVEGDRFTTIAMGATYEGTMRIDTSKTPHTLDIIFEAGPEKGNTSLGIYELDGSTWKLCLTVSGNTRPTKFKTTPGSGHAFETLKRERVASKKGAFAREERREEKRVPEAAPEKSEPIPELKGDWAMVSCVVDGHALEKSLVAVGRRVTRGNETTMYFGPQLYMKARITVDRSVTPIAFDYLCLLGQSTGERQLGIFERDGESLKISFSPPGAPRPSDFAATQGRTVTVWKLNER
jgi:uncharacterized protein (TIGR03067 family)